MLLAFEYSYFFLHNDFGSRKVTKESLTFYLNVGECVGYLFVKTCCRNPSIDWDNKMSSIKNEYGHIDGH